MKEEVSFEIELKNFPNSNFQTLHLLKVTKINGHSKTYNIFIDELIKTINRTMKE